MAVEAVMRQSEAVEAPAEGRAEPVIQVEDLSLTFETADGPVYALSEVGLTIEAGDVTGSSPRSQPMPNTGQALLPEMSETGWARHR